jgi:transcriptional regulator with XRE-family HTH domain
MAVAAQLIETQKPEGKRGEPRRKLKLETQGALPSGGGANVLVHNLSLTGLLVESEVSLPVGETIEVELPHAGVVRAKVVWTSGQLFGCQFHTPISKAALSAAELRGAVRPDGVAVGTTESPASGESFAIRLRRLRNERGLTLAQVADELGVSKPTVWAWEKGQARPAENRIAALARTLGVPDAELLSGRNASGLSELLARSREEIASAIGASPARVRILIEL